MYDEQVDNVIQSESTNSTPAVRQRFTVIDGMMIPDDAPSSELLSNEDMHQNSITEAERQGLGPRDPEHQTAASGNYITCMHCERDDVPESLFQVGMCVDCYVQMSNRNTKLMRWGNKNWQEDAEAAGVELYEQQPAESPVDYSRFCCYRDMYPSTRPTLKAVAKQLNISYGAVQSTASRWHWRERLIAWIKECDRVTLEQRRQEMISMNQRHIELAEKVDRKIQQALDRMDPASMKPSEVNQLMKTMAQLERESRIDTIAQEELRNEITHGAENPELKQSPTSQDDFAEILGVLKQAGVLDDSDIGLKKVKKDGTSEELVVKQSKGVLDSAE